MPAAMHASAALDNIRSEMPLFSCCWVETCSRDFQTPRFAGGRVLLPAGDCRSAAEESFRLDSAFNKGTLRLEIDNDYVWDRDSHFTNAWSIQYYSVGYACWDDTRAPAPVKWVGNHFPTLGDDDAMVRFGNGLGQNMYTPRDLEARSLREGDLPYAGTLTIDFYF